MDDAKEDRLFLPAREETEAYITQHALIALKQTDPLGNEPSLILIYPQDVPTIVSWLQTLAREIEEMGVEPGKPMPSVEE